MRVAILNDYDVVVAGLGTLLAGFPARVELVEVSVGAPMPSDVDVVLFDTFGNTHAVDGTGDLGGLVRTMHAINRLSDGAAKVAVYSWQLNSEAVEAALRVGAAGYISKRLTTKELVSALEDVDAGRLVAPKDTERRRVTDDEIGGEWPGKPAGLSPRESEVIALITQGLSNQEIADERYLSINSVKTYVRSAYRKIGVTRRSQAAAWGMANGFAPLRNQHPGC